MTAYELKYICTISIFKCIWIKPHCRETRFRNVSMEKETHTVKALNSFPRTV